MSEPRADTIRKKGKKFELVSGEGKVLGTHPTRAAAEAQETAVNMSKARAAGHKLPAPPRGDTGEDENEPDDPDERYDGLIERRVFRRDTGNGLQKPRMSPGGFLEVDAYLSRTGVYEYPQADGTVRRELRMDEDVFDPDALAGFRGVPVTKEHPPTLLDMHSARLYALGAVSGPAWKDGDKVAATLTVHDADLADEILSGHRAETSPGYFCDLQRAPPDLVVDGKKIDVIQRNIQINHVAVVRAARGGEEICIRLDGAGNVGEDAGQSTPVEPAEHEDSDRMADPIKTRSITIRGISGEVPVHVAEAWDAETAARTDSISTHQAKLDSSTKELAELRAQRDTLAGQNKELQAQVAKMDSDLKAARAPDTVAKAVRDRVALITAARGLVGPEAAKQINFDSLDDMGIRAKVLRVRGVRLDSVPEAQRDFYAKARFDEECRRAVAQIRRDAAKAKDEDEEGGEVHVHMHGGDDDAAPPEVHVHQHADETQPQSSGLEGAGLSGRVTTQGAGYKPEWNEDEEPGKESDEDDPVKMLGKAMAGRKDSREPRRERFLAPAGEGAERNDAAAGDANRGRRKDAKEQYDTHMMDLGRQPLPSSRSNAAAKK